MVAVAHGAAAGDGLIVAGLGAVRQGPFADGG